MIILLQLGTFYQKRGDANRLESLIGNNDEDDDKTNNYQYYLDTILSTFIQVIQYLVLLSLPQIISNFLGLILFNAFPGRINIKNQCNLPLKSVNLPHLCFRVVTRGLFPDLVQSNLTKNYITCIDAGLNNFSIEIVTDKELNLNYGDTNRIRQLVVPSSYKTSTNAMFKARALQFALENSLMKDGEYIVHLDEETLVTKNVVNGVINFALDGQHAFGQGLITYANQEIVNWVTTLADSFRVADDMGKLRFQFYAFHKPLFGWKGSFVVTKYEAERDVSYDHGPDGSVAEDCYFSMIAFQKGYSFDFISGEMWEKSPFSIQDLIRQRKRWIQGIWLVVHSAKIPIKNKLLLAASLYSWVTLPMTTLGYILTLIYPTPSPLWINSIGAFCFGVSFYMYMFGVIKSFDLKRTAFPMLLIYIIGAIFTLTLNIIIENVAVIWGLIGPKHNFYIVDKNIEHKVVIEI